MGRNGKKSKSGGKRHKERTLAEGPDELSEAPGADDRRDRFHFFWKAGSPFSQWHRSRYELDGFQYVCAEQGMMHGKALLFEDGEMAELIMEAESPRKMKALGQSVRGFDEKTWKRHREDIVYRNNVAKFTQNEGLREALLATTGTLVEASPSDKIWGIGLNEDVARRTHPSQWKGLNLLGKILTRVRDEIRENSVNTQSEGRSSLEDGDEGDDEIRGGMVGEVGRVEAGSESLNSFEFPERC
eukprot:CAMPEP_0197443822 /NCGR_PEP_ID=MMETSP1175-20131217/9462_1 /TAXON_ID=1003142 /ORGANISM="Triceratium dubium, Strain CCMP147" /LENGTH=242 /DNA_ID=CAMNT_0042974505 /DNA_START=72 /DNA_END=804 /DNA_ORIENTATION=-